MSRHASHLLLLVILLVSAYSAYRVTHLNTPDPMTKHHKIDSEVAIRAMGGRVCLSKTVDGIPVQFYCEQEAGESGEDFGRRCRREWKAFCKGFEEGE